MSASFPKHAQVVIIGGGIHGCSVAYHLVKNGWKDVVLFERKKLTSGTTWHAAGLVGQLQGSHATTAFASYGVELLQEIEAETGLSPGFRQKWLNLDSGESESPFGIEAQSRFCQAIWCRGILY
jgi:4-methylaminobutanoate oxidase (formaldehyde-forming)